MEKRQILLIALLSVFALSLVYNIVYFVSSLSDISDSYSSGVLSSLYNLQIFNLIKDMLPAFAISITGVTLAILGLVKDLELKKVAIVGVVSGAIYFASSIVVLLINNEYDTINYVLGFGLEVFAGFFFAVTLLALSVVTLVSDED